MTSALADERPGRPDVRAPGRIGTSRPGPPAVRLLSRTTHPLSPVATSGWLRSRSKRFVDVVVAGVLFVPAALLLAPLALLSAIRFRANPLFTQTRVGLDGRPFELPKVRSLPPDWDPALGRHQLEVRTLPRLSRLLRGRHLDELPQLWCVLTGSMSLVGPRPMIEPVLDRLPAESRHRRTTTRPGLTGLWQVSSMGPRPLHECHALDLEYVANATGRLDAQILVQTARYLLGGPQLDPDELTRRARDAAPG